MPNIDENVVKMTFDNKQFEEGVSESLKTIEDLKKALKFDKMETSLSGLENISETMSATLDKLSVSADRVAKTFSPLGKIVNKTLDELTGPVAQKISEITKWSTGFAGLGAGQGKYEEYTRSVQTIANATGKSVDDISKTLNTLMKYTDETSYDFSEMVKSIGKFTSVGIDLERAELAMEGIANWAAKSGAQKTEANRAMYNISQAMGAGALKLIDWKSIENANMATKEFKEVAIETAKELGVISKNSAINYQNFNETLKDGWLTADVLTEVLAKYGDKSTEFGRSAFEAAQEALTLTDAIDALKDSISSGWMRTMELLFGNLDEARVMWTDVANGLIEFVDVISSWRNELLEGWHELGGYNAMVEAGSNIWQTFMNIVIGTKEAIENIFPPLAAEQLVSFTEKVKQASENLLSAFGIDTYDVFDEEIEVTIDHAEKLNKLLKTGDKGEMVKQLQQNLIKAGYAADNGFADGVYGPKTKAAISKLQEALGVKVTGEWDSATRSAARLKKTFVETEIQIHQMEYKNAEQVVEKYQETVNYADQINQVLKRGDRNGKVEMLQKRLIKMGLLTDKAGADGIYGPKTEDAVKKLQKTLGVEVTGKWDEVTRKAAAASKDFQEVIEKERKVIKGTEGITQPMEKLQSIVMAIASAFKLVWNIISGAGRIVLGVLHIFDPLVSVLGRVVSMTSMMFVHFSEQIEEGQYIDTWVSRITAVFKPFAAVIEWVSDAIHGFLYEYADFLYGFDLANTFGNFFNFIIYSLRNNTILGPVFDFIESIAEKFNWLADMAISVSQFAFFWIADKVKWLLSGQFIRDNITKNNGLIIMLTKMYASIKDVVKKIGEFLTNSFGTMFGMDKTVNDPTESKSASILEGFVKFVTDNGKFIAIAVALIGIALKGLSVMTGKYVAPIVSGFSPIFSILSRLANLSRFKLLIGLLIGFWAAFNIPGVGEYMDAGLGHVKDFFAQVKEQLEKKFPEMMAKFGEAWKQLEKFFTWDSEKTVLDNLLEKFEMLKQGVISAATIIKQKLIELKAYLTYLFSQNAETGKLNIFSEFPTIMAFFQPAVDLFVKAKNKFKAAWDDFIGITRDENGEIVSSEYVSVFDAIKGMFTKFAGVDWTKLIKPALYAIAGFAIVRGINSVRTITDTIGKKGLLGLMFGKGDDDEEEEDGLTGKIASIAKSALMLAGAVGLLAVIPVNRAFAGIAALASLLTVIGVASGLFKKFDLEVPDNIGEAFKDFGEGIVSFAKSIIIAFIGLNLMMDLMGSLKNNADKQSNFTSAIGIIAVMVIALTTAEIIIGRTVGNEKGKRTGTHVFELCKGMLYIVVSLQLLMNAIRGQDFWLIAGAIGTIVGLLAVLAGAEILIAKSSENWKKAGERKISGVTEMCVGLMLLVNAFAGLVETLGGMKDAGTGWAAFGIIFGLLLELGAIVVLLGAFGKEESPFKSMGMSILLMCAGLMIVINAIGQLINILSTVPEGKDNLVGTAFTAIAGFLLELGAMAVALGVWGQFKSSASIGVSVALICVGLMLVVKAFADLLNAVSDIPTDGEGKMWKVFGMIAGLIAELGVFAVLLGALTKATGWQELGMTVMIGTMMFGLAKVIDGFANAMVKIKDIDWKAITAFSGGIVGALFVLGTAMVILGAMGFGKAIAGAVGVGILLGAIVAAINMVANIADSFLLKFSSTLQIFGDSLEAFSSNKIDWDLLQKTTDFVTGQLIDMITALASNNGYVDYALDTMRKMERVAINLRDYVQLLEYVGRHGITNSAYTVVVIQMAKTIAEIAESIEIPANVLEGKLSLLGAHLYLYGQMISEVPSQDRSTAAIKMVDDAKSIASKIAEITLDDSNATKLAGVGAALQLYYAALADIGKKDGAGNALEDVFNPGDIEINSSVIEQLFSALATAIPKDTGDKIREFREGGSNDLGVMALGITELANALKIYGEDIEKIDPTKVGAANNALGGIKDLDSYIKNTGVDKAGNFLVSKFFSIAAFSANIVTLGTALKNYGSSIGTLSPTQVEQAGKVLTQIMGLNDHLEGKDRKWWEQLWDKFVSIGGDASDKKDELDTKFNSLQENMEIIGKGIGKYYDGVKDVDLDSLEKTNDIVEKLIELGNKLPNLGGFFAYFTGDQNLGTFGSSLASLGQNLQQFSAYMRGIDPGNGNLKSEKLAVTVGSLEEGLQLIERVMSWGTTYGDSLTYDNNGFMVLKFEKFVEGVANSITTLAKLDTEKVGANLIGGGGIETLTAFKKVIDKLSQFMSEGLVDTESKKKLISTAITKALSIAFKNVSNNLKAGTDNDTATTLRDFGKNIIEQIAAGIEAESSQQRLEQALNGVLNTVWRVVGGFYQSFVSLGAFLNMGIIQGVTQNAGLVGQAMHALATGQILAPVLNVTEVASPSRKFEWIAQMCALGLKNGFDKYSYLVGDSLTNLGNQSITTIVNAFDSSKIDKIPEAALGTIRGLLASEDAKYNHKNLTDLMVMSGYLKDSDRGNAEKTMTSVIDFKKEVLGYDGKISSTWTKEDESALESIVSKASKEYNIDEYNREIATLNGVIGGSKMLNSLINPDNNLSMFAKDRRSSRRLATELLAISGYLDIHDIGNKDKVQAAIENFQKQQSGKKGNTSDVDAKDMELLYWYSLNQMTDDTVLDPKYYAYGKAIKSEYNSVIKGQKSKKKKTEKPIKDIYTAITDPLYDPYGNNRKRLVKELMVLAGYLDMNDIHNTEKIGEAITKIQTTLSGKTEKTPYDGKDADLTYWAAMNKINMDIYKNGSVDFSELTYGDEIMSAYVKHVKEQDARLEKIEPPTTLKKPGSLFEKAITPETGSYSDSRKWQRLAAEFLSISGYLNPEDVTNLKKINAAATKFRKDQGIDNEKRDGKTNPWSDNDSELLYWYTLNKIDTTLNQNGTVNTKGLKYGKEIMEEYESVMKGQNEQQQKNNKTAKKTEKQQKKLNKEYKKTLKYTKLIKVSEESKAKREAIKNIDEGLQRGSKGSDVKSLQELLNRELGTKLTIDGIFGPQTEAALMKLQDKLGVTQTGVYDTATKTKVDDTVIMDDIDKAIEQEKNDIHEHGEKVRKENKERTDSIVRAQAYLVKHGYLAEGEYVLGEMDAATEAAIRLFNKDAGISFDMLNDDYQNWSGSSFSDWQSTIATHVKKGEEPVIKEENAKEYINELDSSIEDIEKQRRDVFGLQTFLEAHGLLNEDQYIPGVYNKSTKDAEKQLNLLLYGEENPSQALRDRVDAAIEKYYGDVDTYLNSKPLPRGNGLREWNGQLYTQLPGLHETEFDTVGTNTRRENAKANRLYRQMYGYDYDLSEFGGLGYNFFTRNGDGYTHYHTPTYQVAGLQNMLNANGYLESGLYELGKYRQETVDAFTKFKIDLFGKDENPDATKALQFTDNELSLLNSWFDMYETWEGILTAKGLISGKKNGFSYEGWMDSEFKDTTHVGYKRNGNVRTTTRTQNTNQNPLNMADPSKELEENAFTLLGNSLGDAFGGVKDGLTDGLGKLKDETITAGKEWYDGLPDTIKKFINKDTLKSLLEGFGISGDASDSLIQTILGEEGSSTNILGNTEKQLNDAIEQIDNTDKIVEDSIQQALQNNLDNSDTNGGFWDYLKNLWNNNADVSDTTYGIGKENSNELIHGTLDGLTDNASVLEQAGDGTAAAINEGYTTAQEINSPSRVWYRFGLNLIEGLALGISENENLALNAIDDLNRKILERAKALAESVSISIISDDGSSITFRPVVDTSEIQNGSGITASGFGNAFGSMNMTLLNIQSIATEIQTGIQGINTTLIENDARMTSRFEALNDRIDKLDKDIYNMKIVLDSDVLVAGTAAKMDRALGKRHIAANVGR